VRVRFALAAATVAWILGTSATFAAGSTMVLEFEGKKTKDIHDRVVRSLKKADVSVEPLGQDAKSAKGDAHALEAVARRHHVAVFVEGTVDASKKGVTLHLLARDAATGDELGGLELESPKLPALMKKIDTEVPGFVKEQLGAVEATTPEEKAPEPKEESKPKAEKPKSEESAPEEPEPEKGGKPHRPSPLSVAAGLRLFSRHFSYNQDVNANLRPYKLGVAPSLFGSIAWYPAAHFTGGVAAHIGIVGDIEQSVATSSALDPSGTKYATSLNAYSVGLRGRIPFDPHELGISLRYGRQAFNIAGDVDPNATVATGVTVKRDLLPDVAYQYLSPAIDARFGFGAFGIGAHVAYRFVLSAGDIKSAAWFPAATVTALDAGLFATYEIVPTLHALIGFDVRRYGFDMHSSPSDLAKDHDVAGGAVDQYLAGFLGVEWRLPGD
jgi:hypothetical protein